MTRGFTLLEVLVALAVLAIALTAAARATMASAQTDDELRLRLLADWVAENRLAEHQARRDWLEPGTIEGRTTMGGENLVWQEQISTTPNPGFRRIDIAAFAPGQDTPAARLTGFLVH